MKKETEKKPFVKDVLVISLSAFALLSFIWVCVVALGVGDNNNTAISLFASRLVLSDLAIALFSAVLGFSSLVFRSKKLGAQMKRLIHIVVNYLAAMLCVFALFSNVNDGTNSGNISGWVVFMVAASAVFFIVYGVAVLVEYLIKRRKNS